MREIREDFCLRLGERAGNFGYKYVKSRREIYKKSDIFARGKDVWRIYIYDINGEKNGVTDIFDIKNISRCYLENLLADAIKYLKFMQEIIENRTRRRARSAQI